MEALWDQLLLDVSGGGGVFTLGDTSRLIGTTVAAVVSEQLTDSSYRGEHEGINIIPRTRETQFRRGVGRYTPRVAVLALDRRRKISLSLSTAAVSLRVVLAARTGVYRLPTDVVSMFHGRMEA